MLILLYFYRIILATTVASCQCFFFSVKVTFFFYRAGLTWSTLNCLQQAAVLDTRLHPQKQESSSSFFIRPQDK